jgi:hypothetical protein
MKTILTAILISALGFIPSHNKSTFLITKTLTIDSLGACQGVSVQHGRVFLYGDRETGVIKEYQWTSDSLVPINREMKLTVNDSDLINHPTGIAFHDKFPVFIGNSIRLNKEGTLWKAMIYQVNWEGLQKTGTLDGNLLRTITDDACIQGTRPEYVRYKKKWYVATADYGNKSNEVRLYDPEALKNASATTDPGVLYKKFTCSPWVQNLHWMADKEVLVLIQNQVEGRRWRLTFLDLEKSIKEGKEQVINVLETDRADELEGFAFTKKDLTGIAVTSSRKNNVNIINLKN